MKQLFVMTTALGLTLSACGDNSPDVVPEPAGANCPHGGVAIESDGTTTYVCDGTDGTDGTDGANGSNGANGADGANGSNGGALTWTTISADATAQPGYGYIVDADGPITLTLPPSAGLDPGDDVRLIVHGAGSVSVAPNGEQKFDYDPAQLGWRPLVTPGVDWSQLAMSADGTAMVVMTGDALYRSPDSGATWARLSGVTSQSMQSIVSSADGSVLALGTWGDGVWYSTDSGGTWTQSDGGPVAAEYLASSADGSTMYAFDANYNSIMSSTDSGASWSTLSDDPGQYVTSLACSADCSTVVLMDEFGAVYQHVSTGSGWTQLAAGTQSSGRLALSADGTTIVATASSGQIAYSHDSGATWAAAAVPQLPWFPVALSADGNTIVAAGNSDLDTGGVAMSKDGGATWTIEDSTPRPWQFAAITGDGTRPLVGSYLGGLFEKGDGTVLAPQAASLDFLYEGNGAFFAARDAGTAYGPY